MEGSASFSYEDALQILTSQFSLSELKSRAILDHLNLVIEKNKTLNLTRLDTFESGFLLHILDSLSALPEVSECPDGLYGDLGTGAGFPGVPISVYTDRPALLIDSVKKKSVALSEMIAKLGYENQIKCYAGRIEELALQKKESFALLTARALSSLPSLMELAVPLLQRGGRLVCFKSHIQDEELRHVIDLEKTLAMRLVSDREFAFGEDGALRRIVVFERVGFPSVKLPRRIGLAQKNPF